MVRVAFEQESCRLSNLRREGVDTGLCLLSWDNHCRIAPGHQQDISEVLGRAEAGH